MKNKLNEKTVSNFDFSDSEKIIMEQDYTDDVINLLVTAQVEPDVVVIPSPLAADLTEKTNFQEALDFFKNQSASTQLLCPINSNNHFSGLHITRGENEKFHATYFDPMGSKQRSKDFAESMVENTVNFISGIFGRKTEDSVTRDILGPLPHSSIPQHVIKALESELGITASEIAVTNNMLQHSQAVESNVPNLREATNNHDGAYTAEVLVALANGHMKVEGNRLLENNGSYFAEIPDHSITQSQHTGSKLREHHAQLLQKIENKIYDRPNAELPNQESKEGVTNNQPAVSFFEYARDSFNENIGALVENISNLSSSLPSLGRLSTAYLLLNGVNAQGGGRNQPTPTPVLMSNTPSLNPTATIPTTITPSTAPITDKPSIFPTTTNPTSKPTTGIPSLNPTLDPTSNMPTTVNPSTAPTIFPTTDKPSLSPSSTNPTLQPITNTPSLNPTLDPTSNAPTIPPATAISSVSPTSKAPTTVNPSVAPTIFPTTDKPSLSPTSNAPSVNPTSQPSTSTSSLRPTQDTDSLIGVITTSPSTSPSASAPPTSRPSTTTTASPTPELKDSTTIIPTLAISAAAGTAVGGAISVVNTVGVVESVMNNAIALTSMSVQNLATTAMIAMPIVGGIGGYAAGMAGAAAWDSMEAALDSRKDGRKLDTKVGTKPKSEWPIQGAVAGIAMGGVFAADHYLNKPPRELAQISPFLTLALLAGHKNFTPLNEGFIPLNGTLLELIESTDEGTKKRVELKQLTYALKSALHILVKDHKGTVTSADKTRIADAIRFGQIWRVRDSIFSAQDLVDSAPNINTKIATALGSANKILLPIASPEYKILKNSRIVMVEKALIREDIEYGLGAKAPDPSEIEHGLSTNAQAPSGKYQVLSRSRGQSMIPTEHESSASSSSSSSSSIGASALTVDPNSRLSSEDFSSLASTGIRRRRSQEEAEQMRKNLIEHMGQQTPNITSNFSPAKHSKRSSLVMLDNNTDDISSATALLDNISSSIVADNNSDDISSSISSDLFSTEPNNEDSSMVADNKTEDSPDLAPTELVQHNDQSEPEIGSPQGLEAKIQRALAKMQSKNKVPSSLMMADEKIENTSSNITFDPESAEHPEVADNKIEVANDKTENQNQGFKADLNKILLGKIDKYKAPYDKVSASFMRQNLGQVRSKSQGKVQEQNDSPINTASTRSSTFSPAAHPKRPKPSSIPTGTVSDRSSSSPETHHDNETNATVADEKKVAVPVKLAPNQKQLFEAMRRKVDEKFAYAPLPNSNNQDDIESENSFSEGTSPIPTNSKSDSPPNTIVFAPRTTNLAQKNNQTWRK